MRDGTTLILKRGAKTIRVRDWDTAAIASYSFEEMYRAVEPDPQTGIVDYSVPRWHRMLATGEEYYFTAIADLEVDEYWNTYTRHLTSGSVVMHVGAYCGVQTVEFSRIVGDQGLVIACEPDPNSFCALQLNVEKHACKNVKTLAKGLWNSECELRFFATQGMHSSFTNAPSHEKEECVIPVTTIDRLVQDYRIEKVDLIKIDAEGAEAEILKGGCVTLGAMNPILFIDVHLHSDPELGTKIDDFLKSAGYKVTWISKTGDHMKFCICEKLDQEAVSTPPRQLRKFGGSNTRSIGLE